MLQMGGKNGELERYGLKKTNSNPPGTTGVHSFFGCMFELFIENLFYYVQALNNTYGGPTVTQNYSFGLSTEQSRGLGTPVSPGCSKRFKT